MRPVIGPPPVPGAARWRKFTVTAAAFTAGAMSESLTLFSLPAGGIIHATKTKHSTAFSGGGAAAATIEVGIAGTTDKYSAAFDVFQATGNTVQQLSTTVGTENNGAATNILITLTSDVNVSGVSTGSVDVWVLVSLAT